MTARQAKEIRRKIVEMGDRAPEAARYISRDVSRAINNIAEDTRAEHPGIGTTANGEWPIPEGMARKMKKAADIAGIKITE